MIRRRQTEGTPRGEEISAWGGGFRAEAPPDGKNSSPHRAERKCEPKPDARAIHSVSTDSEVIARSIGDPGAFSEIFERHARAVASFAGRRVGDAADDVLSETFLVAFRKRASFDTAWESSLPWLLGIASKLVHRHRAAEARQWKSFQSAAAREEHVVASASDAAGDRVDAAAMTKALSRRIAALSVADRDTLLLYAWGDLTYEEIAIAQQIPVGTVRSRLNRVRRRLDPARGLGRAANDREEGEQDGRIAARA